MIGRSKENMWYCPTVRTNNEEKKVCKNQPLASYEPVRHVHATGAFK